MRKLRRPQTFQNLREGAGGVTHVRIVRLLRRTAHRTRIVLTANN